MQYTYTFFLSTPWGEIQRPHSSLSEIECDSAPPTSPPPPGEQGHTSPIVIMVGEASHDNSVTESTSQKKSSVQFGSTTQISSSSSENLSNISCSTLPQVLLDKVRLFSERHYATLTVERDGEAQANYDI